VDPLLPMKGLRSLEPKEAAIEKMVCEYFSYIGIGVKKIPMLAHFNESKKRWERHQNPWIATGISDLILFWKSKIFFVEIKSKTGRQLESQKNFEAFLRHHKCNYFICRTLEDAQNIARAIKAL
jgi:hypothetical protein